MALCDALIVVVVYVGKRQRTDVLVGLGMEVGGRKAG